MAQTDELSVEFDIFLAYARPDLAYAQRLYDELQSHCRVFMDRAALAPGVPWGAAVVKALESSRTIVVLLSEKSQHGWYLQEEIDRAVMLTRAQPDRIRIIPILFGDCPMPYGLQRVQSIDATSVGGAERVAQLLLETLGKAEPSREVAPAFGAVWEAASNPPVLFGRDQEIEAVLNLIEKPRPRRNVIAIDGLGGIGKTALAEEVVRRVRASGEFSHVVWQTAKTEVFDGSGIVRRFSGPPITIERLLLAIAREIGFASLLDKENTLAEKIYLVRQRLEKERCLVVLDNLETVQDFRHLVSDLASLFTGSQAILTSRFSLAEYDFVQPVPLGCLSVDAGVALLRNELKERSPLRPLVVDDDYLQRIHHDTGGLPLAMKLIAGRIASTVAPLDRLLEQLRDVDWRNREDAYHQLYFFIFQDVWEGLSKSAQSLLIRMSVLPPALPVPLADVQFISGQDAAVFDRAIEDLVRSSLVEPSGDRRTPHCVLHPLTHNFVARLAEDPA